MAGGGAAARGDYSVMLSCERTVFFTCTEMMATTSSGLAGRSSCSDSTDTLVTSESSSSRQKKGRGSGTWGISGRTSIAPCGTRRPSSRGLGRVGQQRVGQVLERTLAPQALQLGVQRAANFPFVGRLGPLAVQRTFVDQAKFHGKAL